MTGRRITSADLAKLGVVVEDRRPRAARLMLVVEWPPSVNNLYPTIMVDGKPRRVKASAAKRFSARVAREVLEFTREHQCAPPGPPYRLALIAHPPDDGRKHDLDNCIKLILDSLMTAFGGNDDDVVTLYAQKEPRSSQPRVVVTIDGEGS